MQMPRLRLIKPYDACPTRHVRLSATSVRRFVSPSWNGMAPIGVSARKQDERQLAGFVIAFHSRSTRPIYPFEMRPLDQSLAVRTKCTPL